MIKWINSIYCGDCMELMKQIPDNFIDMVFVDPPYGKNGIYLYGIIAKESARILKPGKFAVFYASDYWMKETFIPCCNYLNYFYLFHSINTQGKASIFPRKIFAGAKSILVFSKGKIVILDNNSSGSTLQTSAFETLNFLCILKPQLSVLGHGLFNLFAESNNSGIIIINIRIKLNISTL